jgi:hypothetical protein
MNAWSNMFNLGIYSMIFLLIAVVVFGVIWAKYGKYSR